MCIVFQVKTGVAMNIMALAVLLMWVHSFGKWWFDLDTFPAWAKHINATTNATEMRHNVKVTDSKFQMAYICCILVKHTRYNCNILRQYFYDLACRDNPFNVV